MNWQTIFKVSENQEFKEKEKAISIQVPQIPQFPGLRVDQNNIELCGFTLAEILNGASEDWKLFRDDPQATLSAYARILYEQKLMSQGELPKHFTATIFCNSCKAKVKLPPSLATGENLAGCPWCHITPKIN